MPFTWQININKSPAIKSGYKYDPSPLQNVSNGDQIIWTNNDDKPHWPCIKGNQTYFMPTQIAPHSPSTTYVPSFVNADTNKTPKPTTLTYFDFLDPNGPTGTIVVNSPTPVT